MSSDSSYNKVISPVKELDELPFQSDTDAGKLGIFMDEIVKFLTNLFPGSRIGHFFCDDTTIAEYKNANSIQVQQENKVICNLAFGDYYFKAINTVISLRPKDFEHWKYQIITARKKFTD
ncbi:MAG: hypothetical protein ACFFD4_24285 [Candidatus Odinarchaeota archaeon]